MYSEQVDFWPTNCLLYWPLYQGRTSTIISNKLKLCHLSKPDVAELSDIKQNISPITMRQTKLPIRMRCKSYCELVMFHSHITEIATLARH